MSILVQHLSKQYGAQKAVDDLSFRAERGEIIGFLGPNGAGKSTTMKILTAFLPPSEGRAEVMGLEVMENAREVRSQIGYLPEHNPLYLDQYVHEFLRFVGRVHGLGGSSLKRRVSEMVEVCGLTREQNKKIGALSKGYRQRVGLAQALLHDPPVLVLDEPTTGLDPNQILEIRALIQRVAENKTVLFSSHIMQEVQAICSRVLIINQGRLVADDQVESLTKGGADLVEIIVEFTEAVDVKQLTALDGVLRVDPQRGGLYRIEASAERDLRPELFALAVKNNWTMLELRQERQSLEHIFRSLTRQQP